jgi:hypothetical protein
MANAGGGCILMGLRTASNLSRAEDEIKEITPFTPDLVVAQQYLDILKSWIHAAIEGVEIRWFPSADNNTKGIAAILVPSQQRARRPFLNTLS